MSYARLYNLTPAGSRLANYLDYCESHPVAPEILFSDARPPAAPAIPPEQFDDDREQAPAVSPKWGDYDDDNRQSDDSFDDDDGDDTDVGYEYPDLPWWIDYAFYAADGSDLGTLPDNPDPEQPRRDYRQEQLDSLYEELDGATEDMRRPNLTDSAFEEYRLRVQEIRHAIFEIENGGLTNG